jgi:hypothetical protein
MCRGAMSLCARNKGGLCCYVAVVYVNVTDFVGRSLYYTGVCRCMPYVCRSLYYPIVSLCKCMPYVVCRMLVYVVCMLYVFVHLAVCFMLYAVCSMLYTVYCILYAVYCILYAVYCMLYAVCYMLYAICCMLGAVYCMLYADPYSPFNAFIALDASEEGRCGGGGWGGGAAARARDSATPRLISPYRIQIPTTRHPPSRFPTHLVHHSLYALVGLEAHTRNGAYNVRVKALSWCICIEYIGVVSVYIQYNCV